MKLEVYNKIQEIEPNKWDELVESFDIFHTHEFLQIIQESKVENATMKFLCFYKAEELIATSVMSLFTLDLSLFTGGYSVVQFIRRYFGSAFKIDVLFGGTALSAGQKHLFIKSPEYAEEVLEEHLNWVNDYCKNERIKYSIFKEFNEKDVKEYDDIFSDFGFFKAYSIPSVKLDLPYDQYADYLANFRSSYRRQIKSSMKKAKIVELQFHEDYWEKAQNEEYPVFSVTNFSQNDPKEFYELYMDVMSRATVKLETLNQEFFDELSKLKNGPVQLLAMVFRGKILGYFAFVIKNEVMTFIWTAKQAQKDSFDTYQNLMQAMIKYAIDHNCKAINLGQTAYYPKMKSGGAPEELFIEVKSFSMNTHRILFRLRDLVFPQLKLAKYRVFK